MKTVLELSSYACFFGSLVVAMFSPQYAIYVMGVAIYLLFASKD